YFPANAVSEATAVRQRLRFASPPTFAASASTRSITAAHASTDPSLWVSGSSVRFISERTAITSVSVGSDGASARGARGVRAPAAARAHPSPPIRRFGVLRGVVRAAFPGQLVDMVGHVGVGRALAKVPESVLPPGSDGAPGGLFPLLGRRFGCLLLGRGLAFP